MENKPSEQVWELAEELMTSIFEAVRQIEKIAPTFPDELYEARDSNTNMQVVDYIERLARHSLQHRYEITGVRASIGAGHPTDPNDLHPETGAPYSATWYRWLLIEAFLRRAEMVSELIGLSDEDLDKKPSPRHVAGNDRSLREICEHVIHVQKWLTAGVENGIQEHRAV